MNSVIYIILSAENGKVCFSVQIFLRMTSYFCYHVNGYLPNEVHYSTTDIH